MQYRRVGRSGLKVSGLALGTMTWGSTVDSFEAEEQLAMFVGAGGTLVDTAPIYGDGVCEELLGTLMAKTGVRDEIVLAGKAGFARRGGQVVKDGSRRGLLDQLDVSLRQLGTDHLDLWQIHTPDLDVPLDETLGALEHAVRTGRTRYVGISNFTGWQTGVAQTWLAGRPEGVGLVSTQVEYSLVNRDPETEVVPAAQHLGLGLLAWSPLGRGVLSGKYRAGIPTDSRAATPGWDAFVSEHLTPGKASVVEAVARAAEGLGGTVSQIALAWLLARPQVAAAIVGARTTMQLKENLLADELQLPTEILQALDDVSEAVR